MSGFKQFIAEDRRRAVLLLLKDTGGVLNERVLQMGLERLGHFNELTRDAVRDDLKFLSERALIRLEWFEDKIAVAHITHRGVEVAEGRIHVEGVKRAPIGE